MAWWTNNLQQANKVEAAGFEVIGEAFEVAEGEEMVWVLDDLAEWLLAFLL